MSNLDSELQNIALEACSKDLPHGYLTESSGSLAAEFFAEKKLTQERVTRAMQSFTAMNRLLMPADTVHQYVEEHCATKPMPSVFRDNASILVVPGWAEEEGPLTQYDSAGNFDRAASIEKFTYAEVLDALKMAKECPDLPLSFMYLQSILEEYFTGLRARIATADPQRAASLKQFQIHWTAATNFLRFFMMTMTQELPKDRGECAIDLVDQNLVTRAFDTLDRYRAFEFQSPDFGMLGMPAMKFVCPARPLLRDMMVTNGTYMRVVEKLRSLRAGVLGHPMDYAIHTHSKAAIRKIAEATEGIIRTGGKKGFTQLNKAFLTASQEPA